MSGGAVAGAAAWIKIQIEINFNFTSLPAPAPQEIIKWMNEMKRAELKINFILKFIFIAASKRGNFFCLKLRSGAKCMNNN